MSTALFSAIARRDLDGLTKVLATGVDADALSRDEPSWRPLHAAIEELEDGGSIDAVILLLRHGASVDMWDARRDATPMLMALFRGQAEAARILLAAGADPNVVGGEGDSPLRWCIEHGDLAMAATLLRCGATRTIDDAGGPTGMSALGVAAGRLDVAAIQLLLDAGADPGALDADRQTARQRLPPRTAENSDRWSAAEKLLKTTGGGA